MREYTDNSFGYYPTFATEPEKSVRFTIHGEPMSKARARVTKFGTAYTPKATVDAEKNALAAFQALQTHVFFAGPVGVEFKFFAGTRIRRDIDNLVKLVLDAINGHAFKDDQQIQVLGAVRFYTDKLKARTEVHLFEVGDLNEA